MSRVSTVLLPFFSVLAFVVSSSSCTRHRPHVSAIPDGPTFCLPDSTYVFTTVGTDPDGGGVSVDFDWGDAAISVATLWAASGDTVRAGHSWRDTGTYAVRAQATDEERLASGWSQPLTVRVIAARPPEIPHVISGPDTGGRYASCTFATSALHPDQRAVSIRFAWGDGDTSEWSSFVPSGETVAMTHAWEDTGTFEIRAQAREVANARSAWGLPHTIAIEVDTLTEWYLQLGPAGTFLTAPAISAYGTVYVGSSQNQLVAVNQGGTVRWRFTTDGAVTAAPAVGSDGTIYFTCHDGFLYAVRSSGLLKWRFPLRGPADRGPAIAADGTVYAGSSRDTLFGVNPDGTLKWRYYSADGIRTAPVVAADGTVLFGSATALCCLRPDGGLRWKYATGYDYPSDPAIGADGTIYFGGSYGSRLYAVAPGGTLKWTYPCGEVLDSPAIDRYGNVHFGVAGTWLYVVKPEGTLVRRDLAGSAVSTAPTIAADGSVYFGSADRYLYAVDPGGALRWRRKVAGRVLAPPAIAPDCTVYFTADDGCLYALRGTYPLADSPWPKFQHDLRNTGRVGGKD